MTGWWVGWLAITLLTFTILEVVGYRSRRTGGTLSYLFWKWLFTDHKVLLEGKHPRRPRPVVYFLVLAPLLWLILHFATGGRLG